MSHAAAPTAAVPQAADAGEALPRQMVEELRTLVQRGRRRWQRLILLEAAGLAVAAPVAYLLLVFWLDSVWHLPVAGRLLANLLLLALLLWRARALWTSWRRARFTEDQVALAIERKTPGGLENRLINALQLARDQGLQTSSAVVAENYRFLKEARLEQSASQWPAVLRIALAGVLVLVGAGFWLAQREHFETAAARILLPFADVDPLYATRLSVEPGDMTVPAGQDVVLTIRIAGEVPDRLTLLTGRGQERVAQDIPVEPGTAVLTHTLPAVDRSLLYAVRGNDFTSRYYQITVPTPLSLRRVTGTYHLPGYTGLPAREVESASGELEALFGTHGDLRFHLNLPAEAVVLHLEGRPTAQPGQASLPLERISDHEFAGRVDFRGVTAYRLEVQTSGSSVATQHGELSNGRGRAPLSPALGGEGRGEGGEDHGQTSRKGAADSDPPHPASPLFRGQSGGRGVGSARHSTQSTLQPVASGDTGNELPMAPGDSAFLGPFALRVLADQAPDLQLRGIDESAQALVDAVLPLEISAGDDYGLAEVGLFSRPAPRVAGGVSEVPWRPVQLWSVADQAARFTQAYALPIGLLGAVEGETVELALRGRDTDPLKSSQWTTGPSYRLQVSGAGAELQLIYERLLRSEEDLRALIAGHEQQVEQAAVWIRELQVTSGRRWDDQQNLDELAAAAKDMAAGQARLRQQASQAARDMAEQAGALRLSVGMLADTEMVRCIRMIEAAPERENPQAMRGALADARLTQERIVRSLSEILEKHVALREEWELGHMAAFTRMIAQRQTSLADASHTYAQLAAEAVGEPQRQAAGRRQDKLGELSGLAAAAFGHLDRFEPLVGPVMIQAFQQAARDLASESLSAPMAQAAEHLQAGAWDQAEPPQRTAAAGLEAVYEALRQAKAEAARQALAELEALAAGDLDAQAELERLKRGSAAQVLEDDEVLTLDDLIHLRELAEELKRKKHQPAADSLADTVFDESQRDLLRQGGDFGRQKVDTLSLADKPGGQIDAPHMSDLAANTTELNIQEDFEDLVGDLLDEADALRDEYDTYNLSYNLTINETGNIEKQGGTMNSVSAAAATGNQKPPTNNSGGASRSGRQGARAHGLSVGEQSINRRGRDEVQEGQLEVPQHAGEKKEVLSDDPQTDTSTGTGGKVVGDDQTSFSTADAGEFKEEMIDQLRDPQQVNQLVERQGKPISADLAQAMRDLESQQEQVIQRIKAIKKELDQLYLPTDHLEEIMEQLAANLERLKDRPDAEVFRRQVELIDQLRGTVVVFNRPTGEFEQSLPRPQQIQGRILDQPAAPPLPGYEEATRRYYQKLSGLP